LAVAELARWAQLDEPLLWDAVHNQLAGGKADGDDYLEQLPTIRPTDRRQRLALDFADYFAGWEHIREVRGQRARDLSYVARLVLDGMWPPKEGSSWQHLFT